MAKVALYPPYEPPINPFFYPHLSLILTAIGFVMMSWFFTIQVSKGKGFSDSTSMNKLIKEIGISLVGSLFLGFGILFLCLNVGIYV